MQRIRSLLRECSSRVMDVDAVFILKGARSLKDLKHIQDFYVQKTAGIMPIDLTARIQSGMRKNRLESNRCMICNQSPHSPVIHTV